jgi:diguanylate cyclase (GGDEF)-like protein/PAS domain S-box-containing protein
MFIAMATRQRGSTRAGRDAGEKMGVDGPPDTASAMRSHGELLDSLGIGIVTHLPSGEMEYANDAARALLGLDGTAPACGGETWGLTPAQADGLPSDQFPVVRALRSGAAVNDQVLCVVRGGRTVWIRVSAVPVRDGHGRLRHVVATFIDLTAERESAHLRTKAEERLRSVIDGSPVGIAVLDEDGHFELVNAAYCKLFGYAAHELVGQLVTLVLPDDVQAAVLEQHAKILHGSAPTRREWRVVPRDRAPITVLVESVRLVGDDGRLARMVFVVDISERKALERAFEERNAQLLELASHDDLTRQLNHRCILEKLDQEISRTARQGSVLSVALVDLDHFKCINDQFGHLVGDEVLFGVGQGLRFGLRNFDHVGRFGGEEFLLLFPNTGADAAAAVVNRLREHIHTLTFSRPGLRVSFSAGVTQWKPGESGTDAVRRADQLLYEAKAAGRTRTVSRSW